MIDAIDFSIGGSTYAVDRTIVILGALVVLLFSLMILLFSCTECKKKEKMGKEMLDAKTEDKRDADIPVKTSSEIPVNTESSGDRKTLDSSYAAECNLLQCPYCETFNSQDALRCCACGKHIRR